MRCLIESEGFNAFDCCSMFEPKEMFRGALFGTLRPIRYAVLIAKKLDHLECNAYFFLFEFPYCPSVATCIVLSPRPQSQHRECLPTADTVEKISGMENASKTQNTVFNTSHLANAVRRRLGKKEDVLRPSLRWRTCQFLNTKRPYLPLLFKIASQFMLKY